MIEIIVVFEYEIMSRSTHVIEPTRNQCIGTPQDEPLLQCRFCMHNVRSGHNKRLYIDTYRLLLG